MMKIYFIFCILLCSLKAYGEESQAKIELARKMMLLDGTYSTIDEVKLDVINRIKEGLGESFASSKYYKNLEKNLDTQELAKKFEVVICNSFSIDDINAAIVFFGTPEGQSFLKANRKFNKDTRSIVKDWIYRGQSTAYQESTK